MICIFFFWIYLIWCHHHFPLIPAKYHKARKFCIVGDLNTFFNFSFLIILKVTAAARLQHLCKYWATETEVSMICLEFSTRFLFFFLNLFPVVEEKFYLFHSFSFHLVRGTVKCLWINFLAIFHKHIISFCETHKWRRK